eukprot:1157908-Pelagomonas_calceolata.AAC.16
MAWLGNYQQTALTHSKLRALDVQNQKQHGKRALQNLTEFPSGSYTVSVESALGVAGGQRCKQACKLRYQGPPRTSVQTIAITHRRDHALSPSNAPRAQPTRSSPELNLLRCDHDQSSTFSSAWPAPASANAASLATLGVLCTHSARSTGAKPCGSAGKLPMPCLSFKASMYARMVLAMTLTAAAKAPRLGGGEAGGAPAGVQRQSLMLDKQNNNDALGQDERGTQEGDCWGQSS